MGTKRGRWSSGHDNVDTWTVEWRIKYAELMILVAAADANQERMLVLESQAEALIQSERSRHQSSLR